MIQKISKFLKLHNKVLLEILGIFFLFLAYEVAAIIVDDSLILPNLSILFKSLIEMLSTKSTYSAFGYSLLRTFLAILFSLALSFIFGNLAGYSKGFRYFLKPLINLMKLVPTPCIVFIIFIFFFNSLNIGSVLITFIVIFPILYESFISGYDNIDEFVYLSLRNEGIYKPKSFFKVILPESMPYVLLGLSNSIGLGIKVSIMSEIILGSSRIWGIGRLIYVYKNNSEYDKMISIIILVVFLFVIIDVLFYFVKKFLRK